MDILLIVVWLTTPVPVLSIVTMYITDVDLQVSQIYFLYHFVHLWLLHAELKTVVEVCSGRGLLPAPLIEAGPTSHLVQVTFTPRYDSDVHAPILDLTRAL